MASWHRSNVEPGMVLTKDDIEEGEPLFYRVIAVIDEPMVVVRPLYESDGEDDEYYVISEPAFAEFHHVKAAREAGAIQSIQFADVPDSA